jgi:Nitroreductase family
VQGYYKKLFDEVVGPRYRNSAPPPGSDQPKQLRQMAANQYLTDHYHEAPVWIVACLEGDNPGYSSGASIYPAVENMLLAARALGLGSTLTTRHIGYAKECDEAMGIPPNYHSYAILPTGYPMGRFGPVGRGALVRSRLSRRLGQALSRNLINPVSGRRQGKLTVKPQPAKPPSSRVAMLAPRPEPLPRCVEFLDRSIRWRWASLDNRFYPGSSQ